VLGAFAVRRVRAVYTDTSRTWLDGGRRVPRIIPTVVRYPVPRATSAAGRPADGYPLIVFAPGFLQCASAYAALLRAWASAGFVVAGVRFPRTSCDVVSAADEADLVNQPADVSFVIGRLLAASAVHHGVLSGLIDPREIAVAGHSDGGDTVAAVAGNTCCADHRVRAAVVLAGAEWPPLGGTWFPAGSPPVLFVQGSADTINPPAASLQLYQADRAGVRYYLDLFGANHLLPYMGDNPLERLVARASVAFLDRYLLGQRPWRPLPRVADIPGTAHVYRDGRLPPG
jgi:predicted dienelactone hydrolase